MAAQRASSRIEQRRRVDGFERHRHGRAQRSGIDEPAEPRGPRDIAFRPDGQFYVSNEMGGTVSLVDAAAGRVAATITLPDGARQ